MTEDEEFDLRCAVPTMGGPELQATLEYLEYERIKIQALEAFVAAHVMRYAV